MHRRRHNDIGAGPWIAALALAMITAWTPQVALGQGQCVNGNCPSTFQIQDMPIQRSPNRFKFQTRISQAKLPVGDAVFPQVIVRLNDGSNNPLCEETHNNVPVVDSVLNLEIGAGFTCQLDDVLARSAGLNFEICLGGTENCLPPVALSSVPFSAKSNFAYRAQQAHQADVAAQCHYAHRMTADTSLFVTQQIGTGYYDFHTPSRADLLSLGDGSSVETIEGGYLQWTPVVGSQNKLNICGKNNSTNQLQPLSELLLHAATTISKGDVVVNGDAVMERTLSVLSSASIGGNLNVVGGADIGMTLDVHGDTTLDQGLTVGGPSQLNSTLNVTGSSTLADVSASAVTVAQTLGVTGLVSANGGVNVAGGSDLTVSGDANLTNANVVGATNLDGPVTIGQNLDAQTMVVNHKTVFNGQVVMPGGIGVPAAVSDIDVSGLTTTNDLVATGSVDLTGASVSGLNATATQVTDLTVTNSANLPQSSVTSSNLDLGVRLYQVHGSSSGTYRIDIPQKRYCSLISTIPHNLSNTGFSDYGAICTLEVVGLQPNLNFTDGANSYWAEQGPIAGPVDWVLKARNKSGFSTCVAACF